MMGNPIPVGSPTSSWSVHLQRTRHTGNAMFALTENILPGKGPSTDLMFLLYSTIAKHRQSIVAHCLALWREKTAPVFVIHVR